MQDFKSQFDLEEKAPDYFQEAGIVQDDSGAIHLDSSKYVLNSLGLVKTHCKSLDDSCFIGYRSLL